ncbi:MAG: hypothetical protein V4505_13385 [Pseudomonadota bacterium]
MVFLAFTSGGLAQALRLRESVPLNVWCGASAISEDELGQGAMKGVTRFAYNFSGGDVDELAGALDTIGQHHPGELVWIEGMPQ